MSPRKSYAEAAKPDVPSPLDWQQKVLDRTHVFAIDGPSTCVFLDKSGNKQKDHTNFSVCIPIELFAPKKEAELREVIENSKLSANAKKHVDIEGLHEDLISSRTRKYAFIKTDKETLQIKKIFVEVCKSPAVIRELYNDRPDAVYKAGDATFKADDVIFLVGRDEAPIGTINASLKRNTSTHSYYSPREKVVAITTMKQYFTGKVLNHRTNLRGIVSEEIMHALDFKHLLDHGQYASAVIPASFTKDLEAHKDKLLELGTLWNAEVESKEPVGLTPEEQKIKQTILLFTKAAIKADKESNHPCMKFPLAIVNDPTHRALISLELIVNNFDEMAHIKAAYSKHLQKSAEAVDDGVQRELFAKLAGGILLSRHRNQLVDPKLFAALEEALYSPYGDERDKTDNPCKKVFDLLKKLDGEYRKKYDAPARKQGQLYVEHVAREVEDAVPGSTNFLFTQGAQHAR